MKNHYFLLSCCWLVLAVIACPAGEFPLNDDWSYSKDVLLSLQAGHFVQIDWAAMTLVSQIALAVLCCKLFGFSFTLLRMLTLVLGLIGVFISYRLFKGYTGNKKLSLWLTLLIAGNPLFFSLSATFMTDIYFFTFSILGIYFFYRNLRSQKTADVAIAALFAVIATMTRQIGIAIPVAYAVITLLRSKREWLKALLPLVLTIIALAVFNHWKAASAKDARTYVFLSTVISNAGSSFFTHIFYRIGTSCMMLGLFLLPLLLLLLKHYSFSFKEKRNRISYLITAVFIIPLLRAWANVPLGNVFYNFGLGPKVLKDVALTGSVKPMMNDVALNALRLLCFIGALLMLYFIFNRLLRMNSVADGDTSKEKSFRIFSLIVIVLLFGTFVIPDYFFDRYLIQLYVPLVILLLPAGFQPQWKSKTAYAAISFIALYAIIAAALTHDYLAWNRARWQGLDYLTSGLHQSPSVIDGGFEFNGWRKGAGLPGEEDHYFVTFRPLPGYTVLRTFPYRQYMPYREKEMYVLQH